MKYIYLVSFNWKKSRFDIGNFGCTELTMPKKIDSINDIIDIENHIAMMFCDAKRKVRNVSFINCVLLRTEKEQVSTKKVQK